MSLVCNICESKAKYRLKIDIGRFDDIIYFCEIHKPLIIELQEMNEKQEVDGRIIKKQIFEETSQKQGKDET